MSENATPLTILFRHRLVCSQKCRGVAALTMGILVKIPVYVVFYSISLFYGLLVLFGLLWSVIRRPGILSIKKDRRESESV